MRQSPWAADLAEGIFNKDLTCNVAAHPASVELLYAGQQHSFCRVHIFSVDEAAGTLHPNQLTVENLDGGTLIVITRAAIDAVCDGLGPDVPAYFRLRAYATAPDRTNAFIRTIKPKDRAFQTGYSVVEYVDFRLNEARSLPNNIEQLMRQSLASRVPIVLFAFLTAVPVQSDVTTISWEKSHKKRLLEDHVWSAYVPDGIPRGMTVYHWKEVGSPEEPVEDFSGFVKMQTRLSSWPILLTSLGISFLAGVLGNLVASAIWDGVNNKAGQSARADVPANSSTPSNPTLGPGRQQGPAQINPSPLPPQRVGPQPQPQREPVQK